MYKGQEGSQCWCFGRFYRPTSLIKSQYSYSISACALSVLRRRSHLHVKAPSRKSHVRQFSQNWAKIEQDLPISWQLRGLCGCYGVYVRLFFAKIALRGSYGTVLREGVTVSLKGHLCLFCAWDVESGYYIMGLLGGNVNRGMHPYFIINKPDFLSPLCACLLSSFSSSIRLIE